MNLKRTIVVPMIKINNITLGTSSPISICKQSENYNFTKVLR